MDFKMIPTLSDKWNLRFLNLAQHVSEWSLDPSSKVGAIIVNKSKKIVSTGYNGFPAGVRDDTNRLNEREIKYKMVVHAEINAIITAKIPLDSSILYVNLPWVCNHCAACVVQSGIKEVILPKKDIPERWYVSWKYSQIMFSEADVKIINYNVNW